MTAPLAEVRCRGCGALLFKAVGLAAVEVYCRTCKALRRVTLQPPEARAYTRR